MNWGDERYVRLFTRDTATIIAIGWEGRLVLYELLRKVDRAGVLDTAGDLAILPDLLRVPREIVDAGLARLLQRGTVIQTERALVLPNFTHAQEVKSSDRVRQEESRGRRRAVAMATGSTEQDAAKAARPDYYDRLVTNRDQQSQIVTNGHDWSHVVTPGHSVPCLAVPSLTRSEEEQSVAPASAPRAARPKREPTAASPEAREVSAYLLDAIRSHTPDFVASTAAWERPIDLAMRQDGLTAERLRQAIDAAHRSDDPFWRPNVLSGAALRKQAQRLLVRSAAPPVKTPSNGRPQRGRTAGELFALARELRERGE